MLQQVQTANHFQDTAPTSSLMYLSTDAAVNGSSGNYIMYCFADSNKDISKYNFHLLEWIMQMATFVLSWF